MARYKLNATKYVLKWPKKHLKVPKFYKISLSTLSNDPPTSKMWIICLFLNSSFTQNTSLCVRREYFTKKINFTLTTSISGSTFLNFCLDPIILPALTQMLFIVCSLVWYYYKLYVLRSGMVWHLYFLSILVILPPPSQDTRELGLILVGGGSVIKGA